MISVSLYRRELERRDACDDGFALYDAIAALLPESDRLRHRRIRVARWTPLHSLWLYTAGYARLATWLEWQGLIPRADLSGADLRGADLRGADLGGADLRGANLRGANLVRADLTGACRGSSPAIPGWRTDASGYLERES